MATIELSGTDARYPVRLRERCDGHAIIDEIDTAMARHYSFTAKELDFILNYDTCPPMGRRVKCRLGREAEGEGDQT